MCASLNATTVTRFWLVAFAAYVKFTCHLTGKATVLHPDLLKGVDRDFSGVENLTITRDVREGGRGNEVGADKR